MRLRSPILAHAGLSAVLALSGCSRSGPTPVTPLAVTTSAAIDAADLRLRLYAFADDSMLGRPAGTIGNVRATEYLAAEAQRIGLEPAGENGTYFQDVPLVQRKLEPGAGLTANGVALTAWEDFIPRDQGRGARPIDGAAVVDGGVYGDNSTPALSREAVAGKLVVISVAPDSAGAPRSTVNRNVVTERFSTAAGIAVASLDAIGAEDRAALQAPSAQLQGTDAPARPAFIYVSRRAAEALLKGGTVRGSVAFGDSPAPFPARNVVALLPGSDSALRGQVVAIGAHNDHTGIQPVAEDHDSLRAWNSVMLRHGAESSPGTPTAPQQAEIRRILDSLRRIRPPRTDSIMNGADDDGSGSVGMLEVAEKLARGPARPKRSLLFVWHTAEELGLLGSDWFTRHPTGPRDSIVAVLNLDMIGRGGVADTPGGGPGFLSLIGSRRLSTELGDLLEQVNRDGRHGFTFSYQYDADGHPANAYCRSDHYMYARFGIPVAFITTGIHLDYHQLTDEPQYIDYDKLARVARFVADMALRVADLDHRVVVDKAKPADPFGTCKQ